MNSQDICSEVIDLIHLHSKKDNHFPKNWSFANIPNKYTKDKIKKVKLVKWINPPSGFVKINTDGCYKSTTSSSGVGGIVRDNYGNFLYGFYNKSTCYSGIESEAKAILLSLKSIQFDKIILESDLLQMVNIIKGKNEGPWGIKGIIDEIKSILKKRDYLVTHVEREANQAAGYLANLGCDEGFKEFLSYESLHVRVKKMVDSEGEGLPNFRFS